MAQEMVTIPKVKYEELKKKAKKAEIDEGLLRDLVRGLEDIRAGRVKPWRKMREEVRS